MMIGGVAMRRFALFAVLQCCGILAFSQSLTTKPGTAQASPNKPSFPLPLFDFNSRQTPQITLSTKFWKMDSPDGLNAVQNQTGAQGDASQLFRVPPMNTGTLLAMSPLYSSIVLPSPLSNRIWPNAKSEPIPTQWPNAKFEQIPTTWPDLKMLPLAGSNSSAIPPA
jgi:hypothetical protein